MNIVDQAEQAWNEHAKINHDMIQIVIGICPASERDIVGHIIRQGWMLQWIRKKDNEQHTKSDR